MNTSAARQPALLVLAALGALLTGAACFALPEGRELAGGFVVAGFVLGALAARASPGFRHLGFTLWVLAFFSAGLLFPSAFGTVGSFEQKSLIVPLIQIIMFGMGATLSWQDFARALAMPKAVLVGLLLQFSIMPLIGWMLASGFRLPAEIAAGVILIGSCPGGVASNVMVYLSKGNVALSVTMTACSTLLSPLLTPWAMRLLAGQFIVVEVVPMMLSILELVLLPIGAGLLVHFLLRCHWPAWMWRGGCAVVGLLALFAGWSFGAGPIPWFSLGAAFLLMSVLRAVWLDRGLPWLSMVGICYIIAIIAAGSHALILASGVLLAFIALLHNGLGFLLGYFGARKMGLPEADCRAVCFEVGMQNGGMGAALAIGTLKSQAAAVAPVLFGACMNITGSLLAALWKNHPPKNHP